MFLSVYNCFIYVYSILGHMVCLWFMIVKKKKHVASTRGQVIRLSSCPPWWGDPDLSWYPRRARCIGTALVPALRPVEMVEICRNMSHAGIGVLRANQSLHPDFTALELLRKSSKKSDPPASHRPFQTSDRPCRAKAAKVSGSCDFASWHREDRLIWWVNGFHHPRNHKWVV